MPWRKTKNPYQIWLSEIILQQTRVNQGLPYYLKFIENYPNVKALAYADETEVLRLWQGLGYYSRARNLHRCAKIIAQEKSGIFPNSYEELIKLPGVGPYTAAAIASFSFDIPKAVVDGNVLRVLSRVFGIHDDIAKSHKAFQELADQLIPEDQPASFNQGIMEFGAVQCTPGLPNCTSCPLSAHCYAYAHHKQRELPVKIRKQKVRKRFLHYLVIAQGQSLLMRERSQSDIWQGLYDFPLIESASLLTEEEIGEKIRETYASTFHVEEISPDYQHVLSHQKLHARFIRITFPEIPFKNTGNEEIYVLADAEERDKLPKPVLISRYLNDHNF